MLVTRITKETVPYFSVRAELCTMVKVVLRGTRIVHEGHVAIAATKLRLRTNVWWPEME